MFYAGSDGPVGASVRIMKREGTTGIPASREPDLPRMNHLPRTALLVALVALAGCRDEGDPPRPVVTPLGPRTDWIVEKMPGIVPAAWEPPGTYPLDILSRSGWEKDPTLEPFKKAADYTTGGGLFNPAEMDADARRATDAGLLKLFGTPGAPRIDGLDPAAEAELRLDPTTLAAGGRLYQQHCALCHGATGDGRGPAGGGYNPHPRDYRKGVFKFVSTQPGESNAPPSPGRPRRADLYGSLVRGIDASGMPSFAGLGDAALQQIVSYVAYLSMRGEVEARTIAAIIREDLEEPSAADIEKYERKTLASVVGHWRAAQTSLAPIAPDPYLTPDDKLTAAAAGFTVFVNDQVGCVKCHVNYGRTLNLKYDDWGTIVQPRNVVDGRWRGGRDDRDLYLRVLGGIPGSGMPGHAILKPTEDEKSRGVDRLWQVVHFVKTVGNKAQRAALAERVREKFPGVEPTFVE